MTLFCLLSCCNRKSHKEGGPDHHGNHLPSQLSLCLSRNLWKPGTWTIGCFCKISGGPGPTCPASQTTTGTRLSTVTSNASSSPQLGGTHFFVTQSLTHMNTQFNTHTPGCCVSLCVKLCVHVCVNPVFVIKSPSRTPGCD